MMVSQDLTIADVEDPKKDIAFPDSVVSLMRGDLSRPADGFPAKIQKKVLKGKKPITKRIGELLKPANLKKLRKDAEKAIGRSVSDQELSSYLMYPKVFTDYALAQAAYGPIGRLPTKNYFYGMLAGDEIRVEIEQGKLLVIRCLAFGEMDDQGMVTVFFELNGQPRRARVPDRLHGGDAIVARAKAEDGNALQIGAPMPGVISAIMVEVGHEVQAGDVICSIEAMKMETALHAEVEGKVAEVCIKRGDQIDAKDLLVRLEV
jgi:pyruvate carboxylase